MRIFNIITSFFAFLLIIAFPFFTALIISFILYQFIPTKTGTILAIIISAIGLIIGIALAIYISRKNNTVDFMARVSASPDLDNYNFNKITIEENKFLSYDELQNVIENDNTNNNFKIAAEYLLEAVSDWPTYNLNEPVNLVANLKAEIKEPLTFDTLKNYKDTDYNSGVYGWKETSISSLLEMFDFERKCDFDKTIELEDIIIKLTRHYKSES